MEEGYQGTVVTDEDKSGASLATFCKEELDKLFAVIVIE